MNRASITALLIEDNPKDARLIREMLDEQSAGGVEVTQVERMSDAERHLAQHPVDIILLDLELPDASGPGSVQRANAAAAGIPVLVLAGLDDESMAARALQAGAQDYLIKGQIEPRGLMRALRYAIERSRVKEERLVEKERAQITLDSIGDAVVCTDIQGNVSFLNAVAEKMTGWLLREAAGRPMGDVVQIVDAATRKAIPNPMDLAVWRNAEGKLPLNSLLVRRDGFEIAIEDSVAPIHGRDGQTTGAVIVFRDVTSTRETLQELAHSATHDSLTDLPNRALLNDRIEQAIAVAARRKQLAAVLYLDLDGFKQINDSMGHLAGDQFLRSISNRLLACVRSVDTVCRMGGDEFVVLLFDVAGPEDVRIAAERLVKAVADVRVIGRQDLFVTASIGVSICPSDGLDAATLIKNADAAMYLAKKDGRGGYRFFNMAMNIRAVVRQSSDASQRRDHDRADSG